MDTTDGIKSDSISRLRTSIPKHLKRSSVSCDETVIMSLSRKAGGASWEKERKRRTKYKRVNRRRGRRKGKNARDVRFRKQDEKIMEDENAMYRDMEFMWSRGERDWGFCMRYVVANSPVDQPLYRNTYPLTWMCRRGDLNGVDHLVRRGANVNSLHALKQATKRGHLNIIKHLTKCGADIRTIGNQYNLFSYAVRINNANVRMATIKFLLRQGVGVNTRVWHALNQECKGRQREIAELLLRYGADPNIPDSWGRYLRPLHTLFEFCDFEYNVTGVLRLLLDYGANPEARTSLNMTPLDMARNACENLTTYNVTYMSSERIERRRATLLGYLKHGWHMSEYQPSTPCVFKSFVR